MCVCRINEAVPQPMSAFSPEITVRRRDRAGDSRSSSEVIGCLNSPSERWFRGSENKTTWYRESRSKEELVIAALSTDWLCWYARVLTVPRYLVVGRLLTLQKSEMRLQTPRAQRRCHGAEV